MPKGTYLNSEEIAYIVEAFKKGISVKEISKDTGAAPQTIRNVLDREGVRLVTHRGPNKTTSKSDVKCPNCRATGHYKGAKFCYKCGADIRTEADILRERLGKLTADMQFLPDSMRDNAYKIIQDTIDYLRRV